jgi:hypothetical protein
MRSAVLDAVMQAEEDLQAVRGADAKLSREAILEIGRRMMEQFDIADRPFVHFTRSPRP